MALQLPALSEMKQSQVPRGPECDQESQIQQPGRAGLTGVTSGTNMPHLQMDLKALSARMNGPAVWLQCLLLRLLHAGCLILCMITNALETRP